MSDIDNIFYDNKVLGKTENFLQVKEMNISMLYVQCVEKHTEHYKTKPMGLFSPFVLSFGP